MYEKISFRYCLVVLSAVIVLLVSAYPIVVYQLSPARAADPQPCGNWITPVSDGFVLTKGHSEKVSLKIYRCKLTDPVIKQVVLGEPFGGSGHFLCMMVLDPGTTDVYSCMTDGYYSNDFGKGYPPDGPVQIGVEILATGGSLLYSPTNGPLGYRSGRFQSSGTPVPWPTPNPTPVTDPKKQLFVFIDGINTSLSKANISQRINNGYGFASDFMDSDKIVPYLKSHGYKDSRYIVFSYSGYHNGGQPDPYSCETTFGQGFSNDALLTFASRLALQINAAVKGHSNTQINLIAHSQGGLIAFIYAAALIEKTGDVAPLPRNGSALKVVVTEDSPLGGLTSAQYYTNTIVYGLMKLCDLHLKSSEAVAEMETLFATATAPYDSRGESASVMGAILYRKALTNQEVADYAKSKNISVISIENTSDLLYTPSICYNPPDFTSTQSLKDEGDSPGLVYARYIASDKTNCLSSGVNFGSHKDVLKSNLVFNAIVQVLQGGAPVALPAVPN